MPRAVNRFFYKKINTKNGLNKTKIKNKTPINFLKNKNHKKCTLRLSHKIYFYQSLIIEKTAYLC
jgi:hypothetical protein